MGRRIDMRSSHGDVITEAVDLLTREPFVHEPTYHAFFGPVYRHAKALSRLSTASKRSRF